MARKITLKIETVEVNGNKQDFSYVDTIKLILGRPGTDGFSLEDIRHSMKIIDGLDAEDQAVKDNLTLDEVDYQYLKGKVKAMRWGLANNAIIKFCDAINDAKEIGVVEER